MDKPYFLRISKDRQTAMLDISAEAKQPTPFNIEDLLSYLKEKKVVYGIKLEELEGFCREGCISKTEVMAAEGVIAEKGEDAFLLNELADEQSGLKKQKYNFRNVSQIPSVQSGQLIATLIPSTKGKAGMDVFGNIIQPKPGKPLKIMPGKNVVMKEDKFYAAIDGQVSFTPSRITVNPTFVVKGDLDLKIGNIDFIGNVIIRGNVPNGYEIKAGGDVFISGLVEGAFIEASGNIVVTGGIAGAHRGRIISGGSIHSAYLNQADVTAKQSVYVKKSILHSNVRACDSIHCENGVVIGGSLAAGGDLFIKELGNELYVKTFLYAGFDFQTPEEEKKHNLKSCIWIYGNVQPNSFIHVGKYAKAVQHKNSSVKYFFQDGEILYNSISHNKNGK